MSCVYCIVPLSLLAPLAMSQISPLSLALVPLPLAESPLNPCYL